MEKAKTPKDIDEYLERVPGNARTTLEALRKIIKEAAPKAEEGISYQVPIFKYQGSLVSFGAAQNHCSLYVMSPATMNAFKDELKGYDISTGTIRFPHDKPLPAGLVKKLVKARVKENEEIKARKAKKK
jgi:uncharacterized protein YdhG (YjbR/CyaY superfamily)